MSIPFTITTAAVAVHFPDKTTDLLIVAVDIMLATVAVPMVGCFYT
jgi:hypothetical protein